MPSTANEGYLSRGDTWTILGVLLGVLFVIVVPPLYAKIPMFVVVCIGLVWLAYNSHWVVGWKRTKKFLCAVVVIAICSVIAIPQFLSQWKIEHPVPLQSQAHAHTPIVERPTLRSLMENFMPNLAKDARRFTVEFPRNTHTELEAVLYIDIDAGSRFTSFYIPTSRDPVGLTERLARNSARLSDELANSMRIHKKAPGENPQNSASYKDTGTVYVYHEDSLDHRQMADIEGAFARQHLTVILRGPDFLKSAVTEWEEKQKTN